MKKLKVKYLPHYVGPKLVIPQEDVGIDIYSGETVELLAGDSELISTGIAIQLPKGYWLQILDRSSKSKEFHVLAGVIDQPYTGEILVRAFNHSINQDVHDSTVKIVRGDKIAQLVIRKSYNSEFEVEEVNTLSDTKRGDKGFGSTGK